MDKSLNIRNLTVSEIIDKYLLIVQGKGQPEPNQDTTIAPEVIEFLIHEFEEQGSPMGNTMVYLDQGANELKLGIPFRQSCDE